jgi:hypothetical protein
VKLRRICWITALCIALASLLAFVPLQLLERDDAWLFLAGIVFIATPTLICLVIAARKRIGIALIAAYLAVAWTLLTTNEYSLREKLRWSALANRYKVDVLASPRLDGQLRHAVLDGWGFAGMDTDVYVVFDPTDSLLADSGRKPPVKALGIPCAFDSVHQMEPHWYSVHYFTNEQWDRCG